jgi:hypothetical protein
LTLKKSTIPNLVLFSVGQGFCGLFSLPMTLCTAHCASKKVVSLSLTLLCAAVKLKLPYRP